MADITGAHLVGSAPVDTPMEMFEMAGAQLGQHLRRIPDGEVGERDTWIAWQYPKLGQSPHLEAREVNDAYLGREILQYDLIDGAGEPELVDLGYADAALSSWPAFEEARAAGVVPAETRFMVGLPSPLSVVTMYVAPAARPAVLVAWTEAMGRQLARICAAIPHEDLAIQWEVCIEFGILDGLWDYLDTGENGDSARPGVAHHLVELGNLVPSDVELGYHLCYGDAGHRHFVEPADTTNLTWASNEIVRGVERPVQWIHMPVPRDRDDCEYFAPLAELELPEDTELYLGLVHHTGGAEGTRRRIATAAEVVPRFGLATECGLGRRERSTIPELLGQHASLAAPIR